MSAFSTLKVTRQATEAALIDHILNKSTDEQLSSMIDELLMPKLYRVDMVAEVSADEHEAMITILSNLGD